MKHHQSLRNVLTINVVVSTLLPLLVVGIVALNILNRHLTEDITERNLLLATSLVNDVNGFLETSLSILDQTGDLLKKEDAFGDERLQAHLEVKIERYASLAMLRILDRQGRVLHIAPFDENYIGIDMSGQPFVQEALTSDRNVWSSTFISSTTRHPTLTVSRVFQNSIVVAYLDLETLNAITDRVRIGQSGYAALIDREGTVIAHPDRSLVNEQVNISYAPAFKKGLTGEEGTFTVDSRDGKEFSSIAIVPHTNWVVAVIQPVKEALLPVTRLRNILLSGMAVAAFLSVAIILNVVNKTLGPLKLLAERSQHIARGYEYPSLPQQRSYREVDELTDSFMQMLEAIQERETALRSSEKFLNSVIDQSPQPMWISDEHGTLLRMNDAFRELWHVEDDEMVGYYNLFHDSVIRNQGHLPLIRKVFDRRETVRFTLEYNSADLQTPVLHESRALVIDVTIFPIINDRNRMTNVVCQHRDITAQRQVEETLKIHSKQLEEMVEARTRELRDTQEHLVRHEKLAVLGQMAGSVGHELRNPLTTISNAVYYLTMVFSNSDGRIAEYLEIIASETRNAEKIISDLLDFSRVKSLQKETIQVADILEHILEKHQPPEDVTITSDIADDSPAVFVDPKHFEQVLSNLIVNAYQAMPEGGALTIRTDRDDGQVVISVSDTGCGITPEHLDTIFEPLFTTKPRGIGLGLAVCKNLIEANGGGIGVESEEGKGTTFTVSLPVNTVDLSSWASDAQSER